MQQQDSTHPTGVAEVNASRGSVARARRRKANAAVELRLAGATWEDIAQVLGYPTARTAMVATEKALEDRLDSEDRTHLRKLAAARLDRLLRSLWEKAINPEDPEHLTAMSKARELIADHRKLHGLDAPSEYVMHSPTATALEAWVSRAVALGVPQVEEDDIFEIDVVDDPEGDRLALST